MQRTHNKKQPRSSLAIGLFLAALACLLVILAVRPSARPREEQQDAGSTSRLREQRIANPRYQPTSMLTLWWDRAPSAKPTTTLASHPASNIHPGDYIGPQACKDCHQENYDAWSHHAHRWMNALADETTVKGDFSPGAMIAYLGGTARFFRARENPTNRSGSRQTTGSLATSATGRFSRDKENNGDYRMQLTRGGVRRTYQVNQTIGSRFFQYYVGKLIDGPDPPDSLAYSEDHVLPFGYWLDRNEWVPVVHVGDRGENPDGRRDDPFAADASRNSFSPYYQCNSCHTTFPLGDQIMRSFWVIGRHAPHKLHWSMFDYVAAEHESVLGGKQHPADFSNEELESVFYELGGFEAPDHAVTLGVSCEACHLGAKEHAQESEERPSFFPLSPHLLSESTTIETGRTHDNVNWACGRCHTGDRPLYAGGMSTWNSTEYTDAMKGSCYSQLTCIHCHDPHRTIGPAWSRTAAEDDASCLACHDEFRAADALVAHTHHAAESEGSRCMNCHMPRINEGLQNVVRTHTIHSPTEAQMIEANHPNACGLCHTDKPIDWTLKSLKDWYGKTYSNEQIAANYPNRDDPVAVGWLQSKSEAVRLAATDAVARQRDESALPALIGVLDDPYLLNRQFARVALEDWLDVRLVEFGYRFYMTPAERREPIEKVRQELLKRSQ